MSFGKLALVAAGLVMTATSASAAVVCNDDGDCWRTKKAYKYRPELKLRIYDDSWKWSNHDKHKYRWRESRGRGYWNRGVWIQF